MIALTSNGPLSQAFSQCRHGADGGLGKSFPSSSTSSSSPSLSSSNSNPFAALSNGMKQGKESPHKRERKSQLIQVKNAQATPLVRPEHASQNLTLVTRSLRALLSPLQQQQLPVSLGQLYWAVESLVHVTNSGGQLHERLCMEAERAAVEVSRLLKNEVHAGGIEWLSALQTRWTQWLAQAELAKSVLAPHDSGYVARHAGVQSSLDILLEMFQLQVLDDEQIRSKALRSITDTLDAERAESSAGGALRNHYATISSLFLRLHRYGELESAVLQATERFYIAEANAMASQNGPVTASVLESYLTHAQNRIDEEMARSEWLLNGETGKKKMASITQSELVKSKADWLTDGLPTLLQEDKAPLVSLSLLYKHLSAVDHLQPLTTIFVNHIISVGTSIVTPPSALKASKIKKPPQSEKDKELLREATQDEENLIERLLDFKSKIDKTVDQAFAGKGDFRQKRKEGFEKVVNSRTGGGKVAELCAKYLDVKLKSGNKTMTDQELEHCLDEALALFRYTHAKDMFEEFYKRHFAKRLLLNRSASSDAEQSMLLKLKDECGPAFTQRLETMLKDITLSDEMMKSFGSAQDKMRTADGEDSKELDPSFVDVSVNVLTQAHWPTYPITDVHIPPLMAAAAERFTNFYSSRNAGRRLHWAHSLGTCVIKATFPKCGEKELHVSEFQAIILLLFNSLASGEKLSYGSIKEQTGLDDAELKRTLQSLACGQIPTRVIRKDPQGREVNETDHFHFNEAFRNDRHRIRINQIQMKETVEEQESTESRVLLDRELVLQAAAVRILKARKQLKHAELLQEVVESIKGRFQVDVGEIKKTFEILIDKEYMERVEGERGVYRYLA